jgi:uncharacterized membrane protein
VVGVKVPKTTVGKVDGCTVGSLVGALVVGVKVPKTTVGCAVGSLVGNFETVGGFETVGTDVGTREVGV